MASFPPVRVVPFKPRALRAPSSVVYETTRWIRHKRYSYHASWNCQRGRYGSGREIGLTMSPQPANSCATSRTAASRCSSQGVPGYLLGQHPITITMLRATKTVWKSTCAIPWMGCSVTASKSRQQSPWCQNTGPSVNSMLMRSVVIACEVQTPPSPPRPSAARGCPVERRSGARTRKRKPPSAASWAGTRPQPAVGRRASGRSPTHDH